MPREDEIRRRAYELWEVSGRRGDANEHWLQAEQEVLRRPKGDPQAARGQPTHAGAESDDITIGEEAQNRRNKMQEQEKAEGDRR